MSCSRAMAARSASSPKAAPILFSCVLRRLGAADAYGNTDIPPLPQPRLSANPRRNTGLHGREGPHPGRGGRKPNHIESQIVEIAQRCQIECAIHGKDVLPWQENITDVVREGVAKISDPGLGRGRTQPASRKPQKNEYSVAHHIEAPCLRGRPPCTGCPERPIMAAMKLLMKERGKFHVSWTLAAIFLVPYRHSMLVIPSWDMGCPWPAARRC